MDLFSSAGGSILPARDVTGSVLRNVHFILYLLVSPFLYCEVTHRSFGSAVKTTVPADLRPLSAPRGGTAHWRMQAGWRRVWAQTRRRVRSSKYRPSRALAVTRACRLRAASQRRLAIVCAPSKVASKCSTLLRMNSGSRQSCTQDFPLPRAVRIGRREICLHSSLRQEARIGISADVASGRCVQLRLCHTPFPCALQDNEIECEGYERPA